MGKTLASVETPAKNSRGLLAGHHSSSNLKRCCHRYLGPNHRHRWPVRLAGFKPALRPLTASSLGLVSPMSAGDMSGCCCQLHDLLALIMASGKPATLCLIALAETKADLHIAVPQSFLHSLPRPKPGNTLQLRLRQPVSFMTFITMLPALFPVKTLG